MRIIKHCVLLPGVDLDEISWGQIAHQLLLPERKDLLKIKRKKINFLKCCSLISATDESEILPREKLHKYLLDGENPGFSL